MARFLSFHEIERGLIPTKEILSEIAADLMKIDVFQSGGAVVFGSVAWGGHTWRSDIDVADFSDISGSSRVSGPIIDYFKKRYGEDELEVKQHIVEIMGSQRTQFGKGVHAGYQLPEISPSTRDHFILLAQAKGGPWQVFLEKLYTIRFRSRKTDILEYLKTMECNWRSFHVFRDEIFGPRPRSPYCLWNEFGALQSIENFPKQLMRKILGQKRCLPSPDTVSQIRSAFERLNDPWAVELRTHFRPFFEVNDRYNELVRFVAGNGEPTCSGIRYVEEVYDLFDHLPVMPIIDAVRRLYPE